MHDKATGRFAKPEQIAPINMGGNFVASRGPLYIPPSEQGQPVVFHAGGSRNALDLAGHYASAVIGAAFTIDDARTQRTAFREAAERAGRNPDELKFFAGLMTTIASDRREGLDRRITLSGRIFPQRASYLGQMLGLHIDPAQLDEALSSEQLSRLGRQRAILARSAHLRSRAKVGPSAISSRTVSSITTPLSSGRPPKLPTTCRNGSRQGGLSTASGFRRTCTKMGLTPSSMAWCRYSRIEDYSTGNMTAVPCAITSALRLNMESIRALQGDSSQT